MQKLLIPFIDCSMIAGYKTEIYLNEHGYEHYGIDIGTYQGTLFENHNIYGSGNGTVVSAGWDSKLGGAICVRYNEVYNHKTGETIDIIARYMHLKKVNVKTGDNVTIETILGEEGKEGTSNYHLHLEFDTDINYPRYTPQVSYGLSYWINNKYTVDSTVNPSEFLYQSNERKLHDTNWVEGWLNEEDENIPLIKSEKEISFEKVAEMLKKEGYETITL